MKANEIPEKVYIIPGNPYWANQKEFDREIEYIRTDVVIRKAHEWIKDNFSETDDRFNQDFTGMLISSFCKVMKEDYAN